MQYELKQQIIEPLRHTFDPLIKRYGDKPASRYLEGTIDLQPVENFHYRPTWDATRELYDADYSALKLADPYSYLDPRQYYYTPPYVTNRAAMHEAFGKTLDYVTDHGLLERTPEAWQQLITEVIIPLRHYESGGQMLFSNACRFGYGGHDHPVRRLRGLRPRRQRAADLPGRHRPGQPDRRPAEGRQAAVAGGTEPAGAARGDREAAGRGGLGRRCDRDGHGRRVARPVGLPAPGRGRDPRRRRGRTRCWPSTSAPGGPTTASGSMRSTRPG